MRNLSLFDEIFFRCYNLFVFYGDAGMKVNSEEILEKVLRNSVKAYKSVKNSELAKKFERTFTREKMEKAAEQASREALKAAEKLVRFAGKQLKSMNESELARQWKHDLAGSAFVKNMRRYKNRLILGTILAGSVLGGIKFVSRFSERQENVQEVVADYGKYNVERLRENMDKLRPALICSEDFSDEVYWERSKYTQGYGSTKRNGVEVKKKDKPISRTLSKEFLEAVDPSKFYMQNIKEGTLLKAMEYMDNHLETEVFPYVEKNVKVRLDDEKLVAVALFIYNNGGPAFANSSFCKAINEGKTGYDDCAKLITLYRYQTVKNSKTGKSEKALARGLISRGYFTVLLWEGKIPPEAIMDFGVKTIYDYPKEKICQDQYVPVGQCLDLKLDDKSVADFIRYCTDKRNFKHKTRKIMPESEVEKMEQSEGYREAKEFVLSSLSKGKGRV